MGESKKVLCVFGTRPEAIKFAPVIRELERPGNGLEARVCITNQHREMLDQVLEFFQIEVHRQLDIMTAGQTLSQIAARVLDRLPAVLEEEQPDAVLVQGDTTSAFAAALAAFLGGVRVGHIEAGLRTYQKHSPFPEEINRQMTTLVADWHFAPTERAREALLNERVAPEAIELTGNPVVDALEWTVSERRGRARSFPCKLDDNLRMILVTAHRRESFGEPFEDLCRALRSLADRNPDIELVYPVHLNPNVQAPVRDILGGHERVHLVEPVDYLALVDLMDRSTLVVTDSGGIQEEAPSLGKPVLVMRDTTERQEGVEAGTALLVGTSAQRIVEGAERLLRDKAAYARMAATSNPFGDGHAAERIVAVLQRDLSAKP